MTSRSSVRRGRTSTLAFDLDEKMIQLPEGKITFQQARRIMLEIETILQRDQPPAATGPDSLHSSRAPWIFRKLFRWDQIIKKA